MQSTDLVILIVEDDPAVSGMLRELLELEGLVVETAADAAAGLARIEAGGIDLVLLDRMLPGLDGLELCRQVRARETEAYLPIIVLTALEGSAERHAGFLAGADDYVTKPFSVEDLLDRVRVWLGTRQRLKAAHQALVRQQEQLRELEHRRVREELAQNEAVLLMMHAPLQVLLNVLQAWEASQPSAEGAVRVREDLQAAAVRLAEQTDALSRLLREGSTEHASPGSPPQAQ